MADGDDNDEFNEEDFNKCFEEFDKDGAGGDGEMAERYSEISPSSNLREGSKARVSMALLQMGGSHGGRASSSELVPEMVDEEDQKRALR